MSGPPLEKGGRDHSFLPAAGYHFLTPCYDLGSALIGAGRRFKARVVDAAGLVDGDRVLDLACGTGVLAVVARKRYPACAVTGVDIDPGILAIAERRAARAGVTVDLVCAPAERTGLPECSFDRVISTLAFHHLPARAKEQAVQEIVRVLRPGGAFFLVDLEPLRGLSSALTAEQAASPRWAFATNSAEGLHRLLSAAGMQVKEEAPPRAWALAPWLFAVRAMKRH